MPENVHYRPLTICVRIGEVITLESGAKAVIAGLWEGKVLASLYSLPIDGYKQEDMPPLAPELFVITGVTLKG